VKAAVQLCPANAAYRRSLGLVHEAAEQRDAAVDAYERAVEKQPGDVQVCVCMCVCMCVCVSECVLLHAAGDASPTHPPPRRAVLQQDYPADVAWPSSAT